MKKQPDYAFDKGLNLERVAHLAPGSDGKLTQPHDGLQIATAEEMRKLATEPYADRSHVERVINQVEHPRYVRSFGRTAFEAAVLGNPDAKELTAVFYGWGGNFRAPLAQAEVVALTAANPDKAFLVVNGPGIGNSSSLPKTAQREIRKTGSYDALGEVLAPVMDHIGQDYDAVTVGGHSLGARTATAVAAHMERKPDELRPHDPTGTRKMSLGGIAARFFAGEGREDIRYKAVSPMPKLSEAGLTKLPLEDPQEVEFASGVTFTPGELMRPFEKPSGMAGLAQQFLVDPSGLKRDAFEGDLRAAVPNVLHKVELLVPDMSHLNDWQEVVRIVGRLRDVQNRTAEVNVRTIVGHTHANMNQPASLASIYTAEL